MGGVIGEVSYPQELSGIAIAGIAGDQQAGLFGQACFEVGRIMIILEIDGQEIQVEDDERVKTDEQIRQQILQPFYPAMAKFLITV
jgi:hypothetical protein